MWPYIQQMVMTVVYKMTLLVFKWELYSFFHMVKLFDPCVPYMTFEVKLLITFVATRPLVILNYMIMQWNL